MCFGTSQAPEPRRGSPCRSRPGAAQLPSCLRGSRSRYPRYAAGAPLLPLLVLATAIASLDLLVTIGTARTARPRPP